MPPSFGTSELERWGSPGVTEAPGSGLPCPISLLSLISYFLTTRLTVELDFCKVGDLTPRPDPPPVV